MMKKVLLGLRTVVCLVLILVLVAGMLGVNMLLPIHARMLNSLTSGFDRSIDNSKANTTGLNLQYNKPDYTASSIGAAEDDLANRIAAEGVVLMENRENTLPLSTGTTFSFVSVNATKVSAEGSDLKMLFQNAGLGVNETLWSFYTEGDGQGYGLGSGSISYGAAEDFRINECPLSAMQSADGVLASMDGTVPVYFLKRVAGEGRDMPRSMYSHADSAEDKARTYLEPDSTELEILDYLNEHFDTVILVVNSNAALELDWVKDYPCIKAVIGAPDGLQALPGILTGTINPSGRTVDTFAADALASPAAQNFGDYLYFDESGNPTKYNYVSYAEGIYVGYKYYETRYEDVVMGTGNAGDFDYAEEVVYPFGHGLSYTTFQWSNFQTSWDGDTCTVRVDVANTGAVAGKDVVEIYVQSPYTDYDKQNGVEKASVMLVGYAKTSELKPGGSETVTVTFDKEQLKAYDANNAKTYVLDAGDYYITAAANAHAAVNNVLTAKGYTTADGMTENGDASFVDTYTVSALDSTTYAVDSYSGYPITNLFDDAKGDVTYLTRNDWIGTFPVHDGEPSNIVSTWGGEINGSDGVPYTWKKTASAELIAQLDSFDSCSTVDPASITDTPVYGAKNGLTLIEMRGLDFDDPKWDALLDQLTEEDYYNAIGLSGYGIEVIESVNKPFTIDSDTAAGLLYGGTKLFGRMFPNSMTLAQTWNPELALEFGTMIGNEALIGGCNGWYAPSMNIHRTPFSGRNGEYYSEDAFLSGTVASNAVYGAASKGLYAYIKHFAFNDQENHRGDTPGQFSIATWLNEQSAREIYLKPFEMCMKVGDVELNYVKSNGNGYENATRTIRAAMGVMTGFNRIGATWTGGSYNLVTGILRNEWGFDGIVITDNANTGVFMDGYQMIEAGADVKLTYQPESARFNFDPQNPAHYHYAREALHHTLYAVANTNAMNGAMPGSVFKDGMRLMDKIILAVNVVFGLLILWFAYVIFRGFKPSRRKLEKLARKQEKKQAQKAN